MVETALSVSTQLYPRPVVISKDVASRSSEDFKGGDI